MLAIWVIGTFLIGNAVLAKFAFTTLRRMRFKSGITRLRKQEFEKMTGCLSKWLTDTNSECIIVVTASSAILFEGTHHA